MNKAPFALVSIGMYHPDPDFYPKVQTSGSSGFDLRAWWPHEGDFSVLAGQTKLVPTGLRLVVPVGFESQIRMRSGLALSGDFFIPNSPSTIDADFRGEVKVMVHAFRDVAFRVGDRIAQLVVAPVVTPYSDFFRASITHVDSPDDLPSSIRGDGGFGSTGLR